ncbi:DoxX family protein [Microbacterium aureliae]
MTTHAVPLALTGARTRAVTREVALERDVVRSATARRALAVLRLATGFIFLWAFVDKLLGLGFATPAERAWINGGTPAQGFLQSEAVQGPLQPWFQSLATPVVDVVFMLGLAGIGLALMAGVGMRVAAAATTAMMLLMYLAEWTFAAGSTNPIVDYHIVYALVAIALAALATGETWGLGGMWKRLPLVQRNPWLL